MKVHRESGGNAPVILNFGTRCRWVISLIYQPFYSQGKNTRFPLHRKLNRSQSQSEHGREKRNLCPCHKSQPICFTNRAIPAQFVFLVCLQIQNCWLIGLKAGPWWRNEKASLYAISHLMLHEADSQLAPECSTINPRMQLKCYCETAIEDCLPRMYRSWPVSD
jgi:hypothetical protein